MADEQQQPPPQLQQPPPAPLPAVPVQQQPGPPQQLAAGPPPQPGPGNALNERTYQEVEYLKRNLGPILVAALAEICIRRPADPIEYLGHWLLRWRYNEELKRRDVQNALEVVRRKTWNDGTTKEQEMAMAQQQPFYVMNPNAPEVAPTPENFGEGFIPQHPYAAPGYGGPLTAEQLAGVVDQGAAPPPPLPPAGTDNAYPPGEGLLPEGGPLPDEAGVLPPGEEPKRASLTSERRQSGQGPDEQPRRASQDQRRGSQDPQQPPSSDQPRRASQDPQQPSRPSGEQGRRASQDPQQPPRVSGEQGRRPSQDPNQPPRPSEQPRRASQDPQQQPRRASLEPPPGGEGGKRASLSTGSGEKKTSQSAGGQPSLVPGSADAPPPLA